MNITPGEPVPPGFENEVSRTAEIQPAIDQYKGNALVGLEYAIELHEESRNAPGYFCVLCDKRGDPRTIMQHWTSFNHRLKYLEKHYPTAMRECNPVKYKPNSHNIMIIIVQSLAEAIEDHYGRMTPSVLNADDFRHMKTKIVDDVNAKEHFDESSGPNFVNIIDRTLWEHKAGNKTEQTKPITQKAPKRGNTASTEGNENRSSRDGLDEISSDSDGQPESVKRPKKQEQKPAYRVMSRIRSAQPLKEIRDDKDEKKLPTPKQLSIQASHIAQERYKWEKYRCMVEIQLKQMEKIQKDYEKNPEKHPLYPEEWKKFWNRRYKELQAEKKVDPNKYDYKPEWIVFWTKRMKELFDSEIEKKKKDIKVKLGLPENAEEKVDMLKEKYKVQVSRNSAIREGSRKVINLKNANLKRNPSPNGVRIRECEVSPDVIDISDDPDSPAIRRHHSTRSHSRSRSRRLSRSISPLSRHRSRSPNAENYDRYSHQHHRHHSSRNYLPPIDADYYSSSSYSRARHVVPPAHYGVTSSTGYRIMDSYSYPKYERSPSPNSRSASIKEDAFEAEDTGPLTVVAVLRLLTALEDNLGSLGPKVVDLLGKALALEKVKANSADDLLLNEDHCVFFETIKEKLKGLLIADVVEDQQKVRAVKKAIKNIAAVVHQVTIKGKRGEEDADDDNAAGASDAARKKKVDQMPSIKDLPFDRQLVASKLAAALVMQGREDVSTEDMDRLIFMFILMVKLSKAKIEVDNKPLHSKDFISELGITMPRRVVKSSVAVMPALVDEIFEKEVTALVQEVEEEFSNDTMEKDTKNDANSSMLESLTDSDLQTLLQNFKHLSTEEQHHLIAHLKKLETADPARVEKLRKFVNLSEPTEAASVSATSYSNSAKTHVPAETSKSSKSNRNYDNSPQSAKNDNRKQHSNDYSDDEKVNKGRRGVSVNNPNKFALDDDEEDDDYNFDDVFKTASNSIKRLSEGSSQRQSKSDSKPSEARIGSNSSSTKEPIVPVSSSPNALTFNPAGLNISLSDTQNIIANLMGSLQQSNKGQNNGNKTSRAIHSEQSLAPQPVPPISAQPTNMQSNVPYQQQHHQKQQQQQHTHYNPMHHSYNQMPNMGNAQAATFYNSMGGYNNGGAPVGYGGYQQWTDGQPMQQFGIQNLMQQQPQQQSQQMGYSMFAGRGGN